MTDTKARVVVVTGASEGIGAELARQLGAKHDVVVLAARRQPELERVASEANAAGAAGTLAVATDVTRRAEVERLRDQALARFGHIDVWVNNAGRGIRRQVLELTDADLDDMMAVNVKSALYGMQAIVPYFQERGRGHVINISSFLARVPMASYRSAYNAAKAALSALTANLRMDLAKEYPDIHVSAVMPGMVSTDFAKNAAGGVPAAPWTAGVPGGAGAAAARAQTPADAVAAIVRLMDAPVPEVYTNPASAELVRTYYADVGAFERGA